MKAHWPGLLHKSRQHAWRGSSESDLDPRLSRRLWLVKWLLALPHRVVLVFLRVAFMGVSVAALFPIPLTVRRPRALFDVNAGVPAVPLDQGGPEPEGPA
jgi:hypothetical protein